MAKRGPKLKPESEITRYSYLYRKYRERKKLGLVTNPEYTPAFTKEDLKKYDVEILFYNNKAIQDILGKPDEVATFIKQNGKHYEIYTNNAGYKFINVYDKEKKRMRNLLIHRIIYAFCKGPIPAGMVVDHIDNNKSNNSPENLQLLTRKENTEKRIFFEK